MKSTVIWGLVLFNAVLAGSLVARWIEPKAQAQVRRPGEYIAIPAELNGATAGVVFVVDTTSGEMIGMAYDENKKRIDSIPKINLQAVFNAAGGRGGGR